MWVISTQLCFVFFLVLLNLLSESHTLLEHIVKFLGELVSFIL
jgi:hypothetical protein